MTAKVVNPFAVIGSLSGRGRDYTRARNAYIAREALLGTKQADVVKGSGVDKGDVSRLFKSALALPKSGKVRKQVLALNPSSVDVDRYASIIDAVALGTSFERVKVNTPKGGKGDAPAAGAPATPAVDSGQVRVTREGDSGEVETVNVDTFEAMGDLVMSDPEKYLPLLEALTANMVAWAVENGHRAAA